MHICESQVDAVAELGTASSAARVCFAAACAVLSALFMLAGGSQAHSAESPYSWYAPDRTEKVMKLIPGRAIQELTPDNLFAKWTADQVEKWNKEHPPLAPEDAYKVYAETAPTDEELTADFPDHISPYGRAVSGDPDPRKAAQVMITYCPFCGAWHGYYERLFYDWDPQNPYHAVTKCCGKHLYVREQDFPADYDLRPDTTVRFPHLDDTVKEVPATAYTDKDGVVWQLYISTIFANRRWEQLNAAVVRYMNTFKQTGNPVCAHKIAVILDKVADTYYGLPLAYNNELANGKDGQPLTRAEWEAVSRPAVFKLSYLGAWNRRIPTVSRGWLNAAREHIWVEPFARVRHHSAFKYYSQRKYGDPDALDRRIREKLLREMVMMFKSCYVQLLKSNYQEANYTEMMLLGALAQDEFLFDFAAANQELTLYNHHHQDGLNQQGAPNYMAMLGSYYQFMGDPKGWLEFEPDFLEKHPFFRTASTELGRLRTVRGLNFEFGDEHMWPFNGAFITDHGKVSDNEKLPSKNWPGYGVGVVRVGGPGHRQEVVLSYDKASLHSTADKLGIQCWVDGVPVMRAGGYSYYYHASVLDKSRPEIQAFLALPYPTQVVEAHTDPPNWCRTYGTSPMAQNTVTVDDTGTSRGWSDNEGFGELIAFKGGETAGEPGASFQVLDVRDHDSFERVGVKVSDFRRTLLGVEGRDGRPYVVDIITLAGGGTHTLYQSAWGQRAEDDLPAVVSREDNLAVALFGEGTEATQGYNACTYAKMRHVERLGTAPTTWGLTWKTDYAAYAPRDPEGKPFVRPLAEDVGLVRLRLVGLGNDSATQLIRAKGPWIPWIRQNLPKGAQVNGYVAFTDASDFLIERRTAGAEATLSSTFLHVLEGFREGEKSVINSVARLTPATGPKTAVALKLELAGGYNDTVIFQPEPAAVKLPDGLETDAHYALVRRDANGEVLEAYTVRGTYLTCGEFSVRSSGDLGGTIVDLIGDLTGTHLESALIVRPDAPWPTGGSLIGKQLLVEATNTLRPASNEGYVIQKVTSLADGLLRVDLADYAPFATGWHQVTELNAEGPNSLRTNRTFSAGANTSWVWGLKVWFPRTDKRYTFKRTDSTSGTSGAALLEVAEDVDLAAEGVKVGDWFVVYAVEPGERVTVHSSVSWRKENPN